MMQAFWSVKEAGGGDQSVPFSNNGLWWPKFSFKLHKQYLIKKLTYSANIWTSVRSLRLIVWPQEVMEVTEVIMKKKLGKNDKINDF
jgi:hypothetical protein